MNVYQIDWKNPTAPPSFVVAEDIIKAADMAVKAGWNIEGPYHGVPTDHRMVSGVSCLGPLLRKVAEGA